MPTRDLGHNLSGEWGNSGRDMAVSINASIRPSALMTQGLLIHHEIGGASDHSMALGNHEARRDAGALGKSKWRLQAPPLNVATTPHATVLCRSLNHAYTP